MAEKKSKAKAPKAHAESGVKKRNWTFVLYPESAPENYLDVLKQSGLPIAISPLHNKDFNPTGEMKKPHFHVILVYSGPTTYSAVAKFTASLNATIPQPLESLRGMYRYFTHKDNPEKAQYDESFILTLNGFNISDFVELSRSEVNEIRRKICQTIREADIIEYADLIDILSDSDAMDQYDVAVNNTFFFNSYISSRRNSYSRVQDKIERKQKEQAEAKRKAAKEKSDVKDTWCGATRDEWAELYESAKTESD